MTKLNQEQVDQTVAAVTEEAERKAKLRQAYTAATSQLRDNHRDEFNSLYSKHADSLGVEWHPRLSAEQRASDEFDRLLAEFPFLRDRLAAGTEG